MANVGLLAILAWGVSVFGRQVFGGGDRLALPGKVAIGLSFGATAVLLMHLPVDLAPGIAGDGHGAPVLLSGLLGGPIAALAATAVAMTGRFTIGGIGMDAGLAWIGVVGLVGAIAGPHHRGLPGARRLMVLAILAILATMPTVLLLPPHAVLSALTVSWPVQAGATLIGVGVLGILLRHERNRRRAEIMLENSRRKADRRTMAKSRFLATLSHEIRTPLNAMLGTVQLARRMMDGTGPAQQPGRGCDAAVRRHLATAEQSGLLLLSTINQVLDMTQIEAGRLNLTHDRFDLHDLIDGLRMLFTNQAHNKNLSFQVDDAAVAVRHLAGDATRIRQILQNLIGNAIKFTDIGGVAVEISCTADGDGRARLIVVVRDTGPGIAPADQVQIFEEYAQAGTATDRFAGTGLGLSIARGMARRMGGTLGLTSTVGSGSTFRLDLPLDRIEAPSAPMQPAEADAPVRPVAGTGTGGDPVAAAPGRPLRILGAEDNDLNRMVLQQMLLELGHVPTVVDTGQAAVDAIARAPDGFDLVLMDIQMPVLDGLSAIRRIRTLVPDPVALPVIALTANAFSDQHADYISAGMQDVVTKPLRLDQLETVLARYCPSGGVPGDTAGISAGRGVPTPVIDPATIGLLRDRMPGFRLDDLLLSLEEECDRMVDALRHAGSDTAETGRLCHELRGVLSNVGLTAAAEAVRVLEETGHAAGDAPELTDRIDHEIRDALAAIGQPRAVAG